MKVIILCVGRLKDDAERTIVQRYLERLGQIGPSLGLGPAQIVELPEAKVRSASERKAAEADQLRRKIPANAKLMTLDERGKTLSSTEFAELIGRLRDQGAGHLCLIIGGPDGLDPALADEATAKLSFGRMTLPHGLVRGVLAEQLYRAATILAGHPYHRD